MLAEQSRKWVNRTKDIWCELFHDKPMWPVNGRYQCGHCFRYHPVRWEQVPAKHRAGEQPTRQTGWRALNSSLLSAPRLALARVYPGRR